MKTTTTISYHEMLPYLTVDKEKKTFPFEASYVGEWRKKLISFQA